MSQLLVWIYSKITVGPSETKSGVQVTYWKEGGLESPIPPVRSMEGGSSVWLSAQTEPASEWEPSADTSWRDGRQRMKWMRHWENVYKSGQTSWPKAWLAQDLISDGGQVQMPRSRYGTGQACSNIPPQRLPRSQLFVAQEFLTQW